MALTTLERILNQMQTLETEELDRLNQALQKRLVQRSEDERYASFHQSLLASGLVKQIGARRAGDNGERPRIAAPEKPVSETII